MDTDEILDISEEVKADNHKKNKKKKDKKSLKKQAIELEVPAFDGKGEIYCDNRELSWLKFNQRVLEEAQDNETPLCERLSFMSIFQSNLDEFFMVRVGSIYDQEQLSNDQRDNKTGMTPQEQLTKVFKKVKGMLKDKDRVYLNLMSQAKGAGFELITFKDIDYGDSIYLEKYFKRSILPLLSPQVIGKKHPFPFLRNKEIYAVALLGNKNNEKVGIVPCSSTAFNRLIKLPSGNGKYILAEELILHFMPQIFNNFTIRSKSLIRIIRNADIDIDEAYYDQEIDYRSAMEKLIKTRQKLCPVKMEYSRVLDEKVIKNLCKELKIDSEQIYYSEAPLELSFVFAIQEILRSDKSLFYNRRVPQNSRMVNQNKPMIDQINEKDMFLSYPYESMYPMMQMLNQAAHDDRVLSIKMTLYRVAKNSQIVEALINAAENGKEVLVLVELRARFDEENNISWSRRLEEAGCRIIYGLDYTKVHSKLCLITYKDGDEIKHITQVATGNYNEKTAKLYTDMSVMTANEDIAAEASEVFVKLCMAQVMEETHHLLVAPKCLQNKVLAFIDDEIEKAKNGQEAYIGVKINSLTDKAIIDKFVEASQAGVKIDLIVRGICCLVAGIPGYSENITIRSIVGRYLEHSRIYIFGVGQERKIYISSADFMTRNTLRRVEVAIPIYDHDIKARINDMFDTMLKDNVKARQMDSDGTYHKLPAMDYKLNSQEYFFDQAYGNEQ